MADFITVKVGALPGRIEEIALNGDRTVAAALQAAGLNAAGYEIRVNGGAATPQTLLGNGNTVLLIRKVTGNYGEFITVKVGALPGRIEEIALNGDRSVAAALQAAGLKPEGYEIRVNGGAATLQTLLGNGNTVLLIRKVTGNYGEFITVKVGALPGRIEEIALNGDRSVAAALQAAGLKPEGYEIRVNGGAATPQTLLGNGNTVLLIRKVTGNK